MKKCPFCAEDIQDAAIVCKHCKRELSTDKLERATEAAVTDTAKPTDKIPVHKSVGRRPFALLAVVVGFLMTLSTTTAGVGILAIWIGLAFALTGSALKRWGGGFLLAAMINMVGMIINGTLDTSTPATSASTAASAPTEPAGPVPPTPEEIQACMVSKGDEFKERVKKATTEKEFKQLSIEVEGMEQLCKTELYAKIGLVAPEDTTLHAEVSFDGMKFEISNVGTVDWVDVKFDVNGGLLTSGYVLQIDALPAGHVHTVGAMQFANSDGQRFNPFQVKPQKMSISATLPSGSIGVRTVRFE